MKESLSLFKKDISIRVFFFASIFFVGLLIFLVIFSIGSLPPFIPFMNSVSWGEGRLYPSYFIIFVPVVILIANFLNFFFCASLYRRHTLASRMLAFNACTISLLGLLANIQIMLLVY